MTHHFQGDCAWCGTRQVAFTVRHDAQVSRYRPGCWDTFAVCGRCKRGVVATFVGAGLGHSVGVSELSQLSKPLLSPAGLKTNAPPHTPDNIARFYEQGMLSLAAGSYDAAGSMFRKTLDTGLKNKFPEIEGTLFARIKEAASNGKLTPDLAEWADRIRLEGNQAVHDDEPYTADQAKELQIFAELVVRYLFELPGRLAEARQAVASRENAQTFECKRASPP